MTLSTIFDEIFECTDFNTVNFIYQILEKFQDPWIIKKGN